METTSTRKQNPYKGVAKQSNSTRIPETINRLFAFIAQRRNLGEKVSQVHRDCAILGAQIKAVNGPPGPDGRYDTFHGHVLARAIVDEVRGAVRFCESEGFAVVEVPAAMQEQLARTEEELRRTNLHLAHLEELVGHLLQAGMTFPPVAAARTPDHAWMVASSFAGSGAERHPRVEAIGSSERVAQRLGFEEALTL